MAMHNFGPDLRQEQRKTDLPWPNNNNNNNSINSSGGGVGNLNSIQQQQQPIQLQQHFIQQQLQNIQQQHPTNTSASAHLQSLQQYGSFSLQIPSSSSTNSSHASKVDQIIRTTLYDSLHMPKNTTSNYSISGAGGGCGSSNSSNHNTNMSSSSSPMIYNNMNPANLPISSAHNNFNPSIPNVGLMSSAPSPLTSFYGHPPPPQQQPSTMSTSNTTNDTMNSNSNVLMNNSSSSNNNNTGNNNNNIGNLSTKTPAHSAASHNVLAGAAASLQSLNNQTSHLQQRSHQLAQRNPYLQMKGTDIRSSHPSFDATATTTTMNIGTGIFQQQINQQQQLQQQQIQAMKNSPHFLPQMSGKPTDNNNISNMMMSGGIEKSKRSSQSPSDILSRSQSINGQPPPTKLSNAHFSPVQNFTGIPTSISANCQLPPPPPMLSNQQRSHQPTSHARFSPCQQVVHGLQNPQAAALMRPQRSNSSLGLGFAHESPSMNMNHSFGSSQPHTPQPPAAHQSSSIRSSAVSSSLNLSSAHSSSSSPNCSPETAHKSSKTPQLPKLHQLQENFPSPYKSRHDSRSTVTRTPDDKLANKGIGPGLLNFAPKPDIDNITGLPVQTLLSLKQQELVNRGEMGLKRVGTPHFPNSSSTINSQNQNLGIMHQNSIDISRSPGGMDNQLNSRSPMNHQVHSIYNQQQHPSNGSSIFRPPMPGPNYNLPVTTSMPPPSMDFHKTANNMSSCDQNRLNINDNRSSSISPNMNLPPGSNDIHLKNYSAFMGSYPPHLLTQYQQQRQQQQHQQHAMLVNKSSLPPNVMPPNNNGINLLPQSMGLPQNQLNEHRLLDLQNSAFDHRSNIIPQQPSPKQNSTNQRSIITGSVSLGPKKSKKVKLSPTSAQPIDNKPNTPSTLNDIKPNSINMASKMSPSDSGMILESGSKVENNQQVGEYERIANSMKLSPNASTNGLQDTSSLHQSSFLSSISSECQNQSIKIADVRNANDLLQSIPQQAAHSTDPLNSNACIAPAAMMMDKDIDDHANDTRLDYIPATFDNNDIVLNSTGNNTAKPNNIPISEDKRAEQQDHKLSINDCTNIAPESSISDSSKTSIVTNNIEKTEQNSQPSKYSKFHTKKAWLKNYDQEEDQARTKTIAEEPVATIQPAEIKTESETTTGATMVKDIKPSISKTTKSPKVDKKKTKVVSSKKTDAQPRVSRTSKTIYNDSEVSNASTSELDSDGTDSSKSAKHKKLRRMPKRKVKPSNSDKEEQRSPKSKLVAKEKESPAKKKVKKTKISDEFLQTESCYDIVPKSIRCLECRRVRRPKTDKDSTSKQSAKTSWDDFCRFYEFRKLRHNKSSQIIVAGFSDLEDAKECDTKLWLARTNEFPENMSYKEAKYIMEKVGDEFSKLVKQEADVLKVYKAQMDQDKKAIWKRTMKGFRELCDVCSTTLFNCHYVCERCGFVVCIDCYQARAKKSGPENIEALSTPTKKENVDSSPDKNSPIGNSTKNTSALSENGNQLEASDQNSSTKKSKTDSCGWIFCAKNEEHTHDRMTLAQIIAGNCLEDLNKLLHEVRNKLSRESNEMFGASSDDEDLQDEKKLSQQVAAAIEGCLDSVAPTNGINSETTKNSHGDTDSTPMDISEIATAKPELESDIHHYLCNGDLLVLSHARHKLNLDLFRREWHKSKPVLVRGVDKLMDIDIWLPKEFAEKFGEYRSDLVDCRNGDIHQKSMKKYWEGFDPATGSSKKKVKDEIQVPSANNEELSNAPSYYIGSALWRLKDWPPGQDFYEILPNHYNDFMSNLPLRPYTTRTGKLNLACRLPKEMLKPDLGPKMYSAYGTPKFPERGTTNLHLDMSDAINVMVYVGGYSQFKKGSDELRETFEKIVDESHVDEEMKKEIKTKQLIPGALWHVFKPSDTKKLRDFLNNIADERKICPSKRTHPIHDQTWYLDQTLLDRLYKEHEVKPYSILQCMGDAILIPAGAPHQVKNLQNCIKVANDFVSPENVRFCLELTDEFRHLPETHINQEDKLQIKNIIYHSMKESLQYLSCHLSKS